MMDKDENANTNTNDWNVEDAAMNAMLEIELAAGGRVPSPANEAAAVPSPANEAAVVPSPANENAPRRAHVAKPKRRWREGVVLAVGGIVLGAIGLMLGLDVFGGGDKGEPNNGVNANAAAVVVAGEDEAEVKDSPIQDAPPPDGAVLDDVSKLDLMFFDARLLTAELLELRVQGHGVTDESLAAIAKASPNLESLTLFNTDVTDEGLTKHIGTFQKLKRLSLSHSRRITGVGLARLIMQVTTGERYPMRWDQLTPEGKVLHQLETLDLSGFVGQTSVGPHGVPEGYVDPYSKVTDAELRSISLFIPNIKELNLNGTKITDNGLRMAIRDIQQAYQFSLGPLVETVQYAKITWLDLGNTQCSLAGLGLTLKDRPIPVIEGISWIGSKFKVEDIESLRALPGLKRLHFGGNGFVPMELDPKSLSPLANLPGLRELKLSWVACSKGSDWVPLAELKQLTSLTLEAVRGDGQGLILPAVAELTNLKRLELLNIQNLAPMTRKPMDASEFASDHPVRLLKTLKKLEYLSFRWSAHILDSALHLLHIDRPACVIIAPDGVTITPGTIKVSVSAGRADHESGAAVAAIGGDGRVVSAGVERTRQFNDLYDGFPDGFRLTSGVRPPVALSQPCYDVKVPDDEKKPAYRLVTLLPSSPAGWADTEPNSWGWPRYLLLAMGRVVPDSERVLFNATPVTVTVPAYDMKRWPTKEIWGSRTPDITVRVKDSKHEAISAAIAITTGPVEEWVLAAPGTTAPDGSHKTPAVMAVLTSHPDPRRGDGYYAHHARVEIPTGKHWLVVMAPGHKPYQAEFEFEAGKPMDILVDLEQRKIYAPHITK